MSTSNLDIAHACTALFVDYARHIDFGAYDEFVELFSDDAVLNLGFRLEGKEAIRKSMSRRDPLLRSRHVLSNISIDVDDNNNAHGIAYLTLYRHIGEETLKAEPINRVEPAGIGHYSNTFVFTDAGWRIASCEISFAFLNPARFESR